MAKSSRRVYVVERGIVTRVNIAKSESIVGRVWHQMHPNSHAIFMTKGGKWGVFPRTSWNFGDAIFTSFDRHEAIVWAQAVQALETGV